MRNITWTHLISPVIGALLAIAIIMPIMGGSGGGPDDCLVSATSGCASQDVDPCLDNTYDLGDAAHRWNDIYGVNLRGTTLQVTGSSATVGGNAVVSKGYNQREYLLIAAYNSGTESRNAADYVFGTDRLANMSTFRTVIAQGKTIVAADGDYLMAAEAPTLAGTACATGQVTLRGTSQTGTRIHFGGTFSQTGASIRWLNLSGTSAFSDLTFVADAEFNQSGMVCRLLGGASGYPRLNIRNVTFVDAITGSGTSLTLQILYQLALDAAFIRTVKMETANGTPTAITACTGIIADSDLSIVTYASNGVALDACTVKSTVSFTGRAYNVLNYETVTTTGSISRWGITDIGTVASGTITLTLDSFATTVTYNQKIIYRSGTGGGSIVSITNHAESSPKTYTMTQGDYLVLAWVPAGYWTTVSYANKP